MQNVYLYDWLSFRCESMDWITMIEYLDLKYCEWSNGSGFYGFRYRKWFSGISIHYGHDELDGVLVEMSGTGCRAFETFSSVSWMTIFDDIVEGDGFSVTRLDVAFDDHEGDIPIKRLFSAVGREYFVSRFKSKSITREDHPGKVGQTIYFGSCKSEIRFRIYDKSYERGYDPSVHWVRFEMQLRRDLASSFIFNIVSGDDVGNLFAGVVSNYIRFVVPPRDGSDSNKRRWGIAPFWDRLIGDVFPVSLITCKDLEYNKAACERYVYQMAGNSVAALIELEGLEGFADQLRRKKSSKVPSRISNMIAEEHARAAVNSAAIAAEVGDA